MNKSFITARKIYSEEEIFKIFPNVNWNKKSCKVISYNPQNETYMLENKLTITAEQLNFQTRIKNELFVIYNSLLN